MIKKALFLSLLGVLCVGTALAGTKRQVTFKLNGKTANCEFKADLPGVNGGYAHLGFAPYQLPDGTWVYYADIAWNDGTFHEIRGYVPANVIKGGVGGPITVNIADATFDIEPGSPIEDDTAFISIEGTFTPYTGVDAYSYGGTGTSYDTQTYPDGSTETQIYRGSGKTESATFEGTFVTTTGTYNLSVSGPSQDAQIYVQTGTETDITITP